MLQAVFSDIEELQVQNRRLHNVVQQLTADLADKLDGVYSHRDDELEAAKKELELMREQRKRTEEYMRQLVQQKNQFAALLSQSQGVTALQVRREDSGTVSHVAPDLQPRLIEAQEEVERLTKRCQRLEEAERLLNDTIDSQRKEITTLRSTASRAEIEAQFQTDRYNRLSEQMKSLQDDLHRANSARSELQGLLVAQQRDFAAREAELANQRDLVQQLKSKLQQAQVDKEVAESTQQR